MPKVKISNKKGISQVPGKGLDIEASTTFKNDVSFIASAKLGGFIRNVGNVKDIATPGTTELSSGGGARIMMSGSHSNKTWILDDHSVPYKIVIPAIVGWKATFCITGSGVSTTVQPNALSHSVYLSASSGFTVATGASPFRGFVCVPSGSQHLVNTSGSVGVSKTVRSPDLGTANTSGYRENASGSVRFLGFTGSYGSGDGTTAGDRVDVEVVNLNPAVILLQGVARD